MKRLAVHTLSIENYTRSSIHLCGETDDLVRCKSHSLIINDGSRYHTTLRRSTVIECTMINSTTAEDIHNAHS